MKGLGLLYSARTLRGWISWPFSATGMREWVQEHSDFTKASLCQARDIPKTSTTPHTGVWDL
jgi:hypothetical protein